MIVTNIEDLRGTDREVAQADWTSTRLLLAKDKMGFSLHETTIPAGSKLHLHYKHHLEAVYCIEGEGEIYDIAQDKTHAIFPGIMYALNDNDKHILTCHKAFRMVCVFNPPVTGAEIHDKDGAYPSSVTDTAIAK